MSWKVHGPRDACGRCERGFEDGEAHFSILATDEGELQRGDVCVSCWDQQESPEETLYWWRTKFTVEENRRVTLNLEVLEAVFLALEGKRQRQLRELRYLLCLLLMRKRRLKTVRIQRDARGESFIVRRPRRKEELRVFIYDFTAERMVELREKLREIFDGVPEDAIPGLDLSSAEGEDSIAG